MDPEATGEEGGAADSYLARILGADGNASPSEAKAATSDDRSFIDFVSALKSQPDKNEMEKLSALSASRSPKRPNLKDSGVFWKTPKGFTPDPYAVTEVAQASALPDAFVTDGLKMLQAGKYKEALKYYGDLAQREPERGEGWFGLAGAMLGRGKLKDAAACLAKGVSLNNDFPVGALAANALPGQPTIWMDLARACMALDNLPALLCAEEIIRESMRSPMAPERLYLEADKERRKLRVRLKDLKSKADPRRRNIQRSDAREKTLANLISAAIVLISFFAVFFTATWLWKWQKSDRIFKSGLELYFEAEQMRSEHKAKADDVDALYAHAFDLFTQSARIQPDMLDSQVLIAFCGNQMLEFAFRRYRKQPLPYRYKQIQQQVQHAMTEIARLDPTGERVQRKQADLKFHPQAITLQQLFSDLEHNTQRQ